MFKRLYKSNKHRLSMRRKYKNKCIVKNSLIKKYVLFVRKSNKHFYVTMNDGGNVLAHQDTLKMRIENKNTYLRNLIDTLADNFISEVKKITSNVQPCNIVYDTKHYKFQGNIQKFILRFNDFLKQNKVLIQNESK